MTKSLLLRFAMTGFVTAATLNVLADSQVNPLTTPNANNQLKPGAPHWYESAAQSVGPVDPTVKTDLVLQTGSFLYLEGDSIFYKYQMNSNKVHKYHLNATVLLASGSLKEPKTELTEALKNNGVDSMVLVVPVGNLKSKKTALDNNVYNALHSKENPSIEFDLESETLKGNLMMATGNLKIAGITLPITMSPIIEIKDAKIHLKGIQKLKMSDYGVKLPSISIQGTSISCTDEIEIHYDLVFAPPVE